MGLVVPLEPPEHAAAVIEKAAKRTRECGVMRFSGLKSLRGVKVLGVKSGMRE